METGLWTHFEDTSVSVHWVKLTDGGVTKDRYGMIIVDLNNLG
jgi:hypothetical protein